MQFRRFNEAGIDAFRSYLHRLREEPSLPPPVSLLSDPSVSEPLDPALSAEPEPFENRHAFARWLHAAAESAGTPIPRHDAGFWAWLSLALFDQVSPADGNGRRKPGADARHIPDRANWQRRYRHLLANPYDVLSLHRDDPARAMVVLVNPLHQPGELTEQFTARTDIVACPGTMALATYLYIDPETLNRRTGASGTSARRFGKLMNQYTRTWDLPEMRPSQFAEMLPNEFDRFRRSARSREAVVAS